jgi:hypothetical protein
MLLGGKCAGNPQIYAKTGGKYKAFADHFRGTERFVVISWEMREKYWRPCD